MPIFCRDCDAEILHAEYDAPDLLCDKCLGLEYVGDTVFSIDPECKDTNDYVGSLSVAKVEKKPPHVVQLSAQWRDDEDVAEVAAPLEPIYLTKTAALKLIAMLKRAVADEAQPSPRRRPVSAKAV